MRIGIDCRMYGLKHAGIGRYVQNLVEELTKLETNNEFVLFVRKDFEAKIENKRSKVKIVVADVGHYSLKEQLFLPFILYRERLDLAHFPHFNVPVFYFKKYVVTIHDLIKHSSKGIQTTTRSPWIYWFKYVGYKIVFWLAAKRARRIIVPSRAVKNDLLREYGLNPQKISVTYEGMDGSIKGVKNAGSIKSILDKYNIKKPYILYVGSVYPHKNIENLIKAVKILDQNLVIVCARSVFWKKLKLKIKELKAEKLVNLAGFVPDEELGTLYNQAEAFVFPSLSEGFGLPGLEAMAQKVPVVASDIAVFREIYKNSAAYFKPLDPKDMADKIKLVISDKKKRDKMIEEGSSLAKTYSWKKMARETLEVYNSFGAN